MGSTLSDRKTQQDDEIVLDLLDAVDGNAVVTQRHLAQELGIALGLANTYLKRCVRKGLLKVAKVPAKRYAYYITPKGFAEKSRLTGRYLASSFDFLRRARTELQDIFAGGLKAGKRRFLLVGDGDLAEIATLVAGNAGVEIVHIVGVRQGALDALPPGADFDIAVLTATDAPGEAYALAVSGLGGKPVRAPKLENPALRRCREATMMSGKRWYVAQTRTNGEFVARENLARQGFGVYLPRFRKTRRHARRIEVVLRPLFPQYLFVALDLATDRWRSVMSTIGVRSLVSVGGSPTPLPDYVMDAIRDREDDDGMVALPPTTIRAGTSVSVLDGLFSGCVGTLGEIADERRVAVLMSVLGRDVKTIVPVEFISAA